MSTEKEAGLAALQAGKPAEALPYLERAVNDTPNDLQALLSLGNAYGQLRRHNDAVRIVLQAVTLQPSYAEARYSLALAYENAGHREYALTAAQQALVLQPTDTRAQALVARLSGASGEPTQAYLNSPSAAQTSYNQPTSPPPGQPTLSMSPTPSSYGQSPSSSGVGGSPAGPTATPYGAPTSGSIPPQTGTEQPYRNQGAAAYGSAPPSTYYTPLRPDNGQSPDKFDMKQAIADWVLVIREPNAFFREQAERSGYNAPLAFLLAFGLATILLGILSGLIQLALHPASAFDILVNVFIGATGGLTGVLTGAFIWAGVLHLVGRMFGNRQPFYRTFRVSAYSRAPLLFFSLLSALILPFVVPVKPIIPHTTGSASPFGQLTPVQFSAPSTSGDSSNAPAYPQRTTSSGGSSNANPFNDPAFIKAMQGVEMQGILVIAALSLSGMIWVLCLQAIGLRYAQDLSPGSAAGTVFVSVAIPALLVILLIGLLGAIIVSLIGAASHHAPGFIQGFSLLSSSSAVWRGL